MQKVWLLLRCAGLEVYKLLTTPYVIKSCLSLVSVVFSFVLLTLWWLKCYTHHGESVHVPNFIGMGFREASQKALARGFGVVINDSLYVPGKPPGIVLLQNPKPQSRVKEGRTIYLTIAKRNPDVVRLPALVGNDDYDLYSRKCLRLGLKPRVIARIVAPKLAPNTIVAVLFRGDTITEAIRYGFEVEMGSEIDFIVSEKVTLLVNIPNCTCLTYDAARFLISSSNLNLGAVIPDATVVDLSSAYVWRQSPPYEPNGTIRVGEQIDLYLTQERPAGCPE